MKLLREFDGRNYAPDWPVRSREAVRAIILRDEQIAMVKSETAGYYKFPGGGIEPGETHTEALIRETLEETGLRIRPGSIREFGWIRERRKGFFEPALCFLQDSYYYLADVAEGVSETNLDGYEAELGYHLEWTDLRWAQAENERLGDPETTPYILREAYVLGLLRKEEA